MTCPEEDYLEDCPPSPAPDGHFPYLQQLVAHGNKKGKRTSQHFPFLDSASPSNQVPVSLCPLGVEVLTLTALKAKIPSHGALHGPFIIKTKVKYHQILY